MNQPDSKKIREAYHALLIMIMTFFMILIPMIPSLKAKAAPEMIKKIYIYDFNPQVNDEMSYQQARSALVSACTMADDAPYVTDVSNSSISQSGLSWDTKLKSGSATFGLRLFALPKGNEVPNPDYDFDRDHLDEIEVYINNEKRSDVTVDNYNEWWRSVMVNIPITVSHYTGTKYSVTFNSNGGSSVATQYVAANYYAIEPEEPTYDGYIHKGWYTDQDLTNRFTFYNTPITKNIVLYAKWEKVIVAENIKRIDFNNFYPKLDNGMTGTEGVASLQSTYTHPDDAHYEKDLSNSCIIQDDKNMQFLTLKEGKAVYSAKIFALPYGNRVQNPDYDFDCDHLDEIEVYINGVKRSDVTVVDYNEYWRCVSVRIPVTVGKAKDPITGTLSITGTVQSGETLTAKVTNSNTSSFNYEWMRNNSVISGETSSTYTLTSYDVGKKITCTVTDATSTYNGQLQATTTEYVLKAKGPDAPTGLTPITPSKKGASDGKITGVSINMEYSTEEDFSEDVNSCTSNTITGLKAGTYYVRVKANSSTFEGKAAKVIVKDGPEVHTHGGSNLITHPAIAATCADPGSNLYYECSCGKYFSDSTCKTEIQKNSWIIKAKGHDWSAPTYTWSSDNSQCTAVKVCKNDKNHYIKETENTSYKVTKQPTETTTGTGVYTVTFTKSDFTTQTKTVTIAKLSHKHKPQHYGAVAATCTTAGNLEYYSCECGKYFSDYACTTEINKDSWVIKAKGHNYGAPTYTWSSDNKSVTATKVCKNDSSHVITKKVDTVYKVITQPTETKEGVGQYTATFTTDGFTTQTKTVTISKTSHKHSGSNVTYHAAIAATCTTAGNSAYYSCTCGKYFSNKACTKEINKNSWIIKAKGHNYGYATYTWSSDNKTVTGVRVCKNDKSHKVTEKVNTTYFVVTEATETTEGLGRYTAKFAKSGFTTQNKEVTIPKIGHKHSGSNVTYHKAVAATCEKAGNSAYYSCNCGKYFSDKACTKEINKNSWIIKAKGHNYGEVSYTWSSDNKTATATKVCKNDKSHKVTEKVTTTYKVIKDATEKATGVGRYTATFKTEGFKTQTKDVTIPKLNPGQVDVTKKFSDVKAGEWYVNAIQFVFDKKIMSGVSDTMFGTQSVITREQFVTVLYNMENQPSVKYRKIFTDVPDKQYYSKAVIWAYDSKITKGVSDTVFGTGNNISREQLATMLYNYAQYKKLKGVTKNKDLSTFPDYKNISSWAKEGMTWAVSNGIVNGKASNGKNYLDPAGKATRAESAQMIKNLFDNVIKK